MPSVQFQVIMQLEWLGVVYSSARKAFEKLYGVKPLWKYLGKQASQRNVLFLFYFIIFRCACLMFIKHE